LVDKRWVIVGASTRHHEQRYDEAFNRSAVELWLPVGKSAGQLAADMGITSQSLKLWNKQLADLRAGWGIIRIVGSKAPVKLTANG
jgi:transposase-like protein